MTPVFTNKKHDETSRGNCLRASLASYFEVDIDSMPFFEDMPRESWKSAMRVWVECKGFMLNEQSHDPQLEDFYLAVGLSTALPVLHCVVYKSGALVHDPMAGGTGLADTRKFWFFTPMDYGY